MLSVTDEDLWEGSSDWFNKDFRREPYYADTSYTYMDIVDNFDSIFGKENKHDK